MFVFLRSFQLGGDLGPNFTLTADVGSVSPSSVTKSELFAGINVEVNDEATKITVTSVGTCSNYTVIDIVNDCISGITSTATSSLTVTPTQTSTPIPEINLKKTSLELENMSSIPQQPGSLALAVPITYDLEASYASATHFSHAGVGGFVELPTIESRNSIPTHPDGVMHEGGFSSGRRKLGMIVFVQETNKFYQLAPKNGSERVSLQDWQTKLNYEKVLLLDPSRQPVYDENSGDFFSGSGNAEDAWVEIEVLDTNKAVISKDSSVNNIIALTQSEYDNLAEVDPKTLYIISE